MTMTLSVVAYLLLSSLCLICVAGLAPVLVTGGAGYIGSHTCVALLEAGRDVVVYDDLSNSALPALDRVRSLASSSTPNPGSLHFELGDVRDPARLSEVLEKYRPDSCIHFAGLKAVGESGEKPLDYYDCNIAGSVTLLKCLQSSGVRNFVFSSSATVYGDPPHLPIPESSPLTSTNPYGRTKLYIENILRDLHASDPTWRIYILRYFNPIGAHPSGLIGEDPKGIPNNLMPFVAQVCVGRRDRLSVFGGDYDTRDGTGVRDYIHVCDLADGHVAAVAGLGGMGEGGGCDAVNLGTGVGCSVLELVEGMREASGREVPYDIVGRREGDVAECYCDPGKAERALGWRAKRTVKDCCEDTWRWQSNNPNGYEL